MSGLFHSATQSSHRWGYQVCIRNVPQICSSFMFFTQQIREVFKNPAGGRDISLQLLQLQQGSITTRKYTTQIRKLAAQSGWNDTALLAVFMEGLHLGLQMELASKGASLALSQLITLVVCLNNLLCCHNIYATYIYIYNSCIYIYNTILLLQYNLLFSFVFLCFWFCALFIFFFYCRLWFVWICLLILLLYSIYLLFCFWTLPDSCLFLAYHLDLLLECK